MPGGKKKGAADKRKKQQERRAKQEAAQELNETVTEFRRLLLAGRKEYAKGRAYDAVSLQNEALALGSGKLPRFEDDSLVKAHALLELAFAKSAIITDFAKGEEWEQVRKDLREAFAGALQIYEARVRDGTLNKFRKEECWIDRSVGEYLSPVSHTERLGPVDYLQCLKMYSAEDPSSESVRSFKLAIDFLTKFQASGCVIVLESGGALEGEVPPGSMQELTNILHHHEAAVTGQTSVVDAMNSLHPFNDREELRHTGTRGGKCKNTREKMAKDAEKYGFQDCGNPDCDKVENQPKQFMTCSRCKITPIAAGNARLVIGSVTKKWSARRNSNA